MTGRLVHDPARGGGRTIGRDARIRAALVHGQKVLLAERGRFFGVDLGSDDRLIFTEPKHREDGLGPPRP